MAIKCVDSVLPNGRRLAGRRIVVTGAASGMGKAIAILFAHEGAKLALLDVRHEPLEEMAAGIGGVSLCADVSSQDEVAKAIALANDAMGGLDGLVNAAGILHTASIADTEPVDWRRLHDVNLFGPYLVCRAALPVLRENDEATIVNIASLGGIRTPPMMASYAAAKAGLIAFTEGLAIELAPRIRANSICPGIIRTPMTDALWAGRGDEPEPSMELRVGLGRKGTPMEVAYLALFLTGRESAFINGQAIVIDGGPPNPRA